MRSPLEAIPCDILQHIAILACSSSIFDPPVEILRLMLTGPAFYDAINIRSAPHIYARIFATKFDTAAPFRRYRSTITDSALASELADRCRLLRRSKRGDVSIGNLFKDLSTALWMFLESDGLNERQLLNVGFPHFIVQVARSHLKTSPSRGAFHGHKPTLTAKTIVWLMCLGFSRRFIFEMPEDGRKELYALIFPYILSVERNISAFGSCPDFSSTTLDGVPAYAVSQACAAYIPNPSTAASNLASVIFESARMKMPFHLKDTRVTPLPVVQPTKSDFKAFAAYKTPLFAESLSANDSETLGISGATTSRSSLHDLEFRHLMVRTPSNASYPKARYTLGSMTAVWEGVFRTIDAPAGSAAVNGLSAYSVFIKPIQCALHEYVNDGSTTTKGHIETLSLSDIFLNEDCSELYARRCTYRRHDALQDPMADPPVHDVILHGETLENHDQAWGGYRFWGVVDEDGRVTLKRFPKEINQEIFEGVWEFNGRLCFGSALIGLWRMIGDSDNVYHGIFSMTRM